MSTVGISTSSFVQGAQYFQDRKNDLQQLGAALQSGDLAGAQQDFAQIQTLGANGPFANGKAFALTGRQQDFTAIGQALQSGDIAGAQQALAQLQSTFTKGGGTTGPVLDPGPAVIINLSTGGAAATTTPAATTAPTTTETATPPITANTTDPAITTTAASAAGPEIILNIGSGSAGGTPEEITLSFTNTSNGAEQLTIGVGSQQTPNTQQVTLNLPQNSNEQIVLNLLNNASTSASLSSSSASSGVNVVA